MDNSLAGRVSSINFLPTSGGNVEGKRKAIVTNSQPWDRKGFLRLGGIAVFLYTTKQFLLFLTATLTTQVVNIFFLILISEV